MITENAKKPDLEITNKTTKGEMFKAFYSNHADIDVAIPMEYWKEIGDDKFHFAMVYEKTGSAFGELVDIRTKVNLIVKGET
ncbi:MAG: hypothetical protein ACJAXY_002117 [Nonlabens sp.]|jgi:hypothetical protein